MVVSHRYGFQRPSIKRTEEGIATMSGNIASVDEEPLEADLRELVRKTVQETLNALLDEEADEMVGAERYGRTAAREAYRSGHYNAGNQASGRARIGAHVRQLRIKLLGLIPQVQIDPLVEGYGVTVATGLPVAGHTRLYQQPLALVVVVGCHLVRQRGARAHDAHPFCQDEKTRLPAEMLRLDS